jgi:hypothetical protein
VESELSGEASARAQVVQAALREVPYRRSVRPV